jgi:M6 family metalloprotease-like protein
MKHAIALLAAITIQLAPAPGRAAQPGEEPPARSEFVPRAGYKRTVDVLALRRTRAARVPNALPAAVTELRGERSIPTILVSFANRDAPFPTASYQETLFGGSAAGATPRPTMTQYYADLSNGRFRVTGQVLGWFELPEDDAHYENGENGGGAPFGDLLRIGLERADGQVDFARFDNDGPDGVPNSGDDDGIVDTVFFIHPESGGECGGDNPDIWSHSWHYSEPSYGHDGPFETQDVRRDADGNAVLADDGSETHILVEDYTIQPGIACKQAATDPDRITPIGVFTHEYGHALGLPDLYDRTPRNGSDSEGIGSWCLMAGGSWGYQQRRPETPVRLSAWALWRLGWANVERFDAPGWVSFEPVADGNQIYGFDVPGTSGRESFLVELRDPTWTDPLARRLNWDRDLPAPGLAVWHVDERVGAESATWPFAPHDRGQNDAPSIAGRAKHALVALVQGDCRQDLERRSNSGDDGDLWLTDQSFGVSAAPCLASSAGYDGRATGLALTQINLAQRRAFFAMAEGPVLASPAPPPVELPDVAAPAAAREAAAPAPRALRAGRIRELQSLDARLADGAPPPPPEALRELSAASEPELKRAVPIERQPMLREALAKGRRREIRADAAPQGALEEKLAEVRRESAGHDIVVQTDPTGTKVERITGLELATEAPSREADAQRKVEELKPVLGENVDLRAVAPEKPDGKRSFEQVVKVDGKSLPVFSRGVSVYYAPDGNVSAVTSRTVDPAAVATAPAAALDAAKARSIAAAELALEGGRAGALEDKGEGVYLVDGDPAAGRVVRRLALPAGEQQPAIDIYVDSATQSVLAIE